jgi:hypothetical protein
MEDESGLAITVDVRRELLKRESKIGMREVTKACLNAPMLRKWNWLSPDADQDVDHWRSIAAEKIGNVVLINGVPCLRAFEPCYALTTAYGAPQIQVASKRVFATQVHVADKKADGLEVLGEEATFYKSHYFAASDFEGAVAFADTIGWRLLPNQRPNIRIRDESAITDDFDILETVRHARLLLEAMDSRHFQYEVQNNAGKTTEFATKLAQLVADAKVLKDEVLSWQTNRDDVTALRRELTKLAEHALDCSDCGRRRPGSSSPILLAVHHRRGPAWEITGQLKEFIARADQAEVNLDIPMTRSLGR